MPPVPRRPGTAAPGATPGLGIAGVSTIENINAAGCVGTSLIAAPPGSIVEPESTGAAVTSGAARVSSPSGRRRQLPRPSANRLRPSSAQAGQSRRHKPSSPRRPRAAEARPVAVVVELVRHAGGRRKDLRVRAAAHIVRRHRNPRVVARLRRRRSALPVDDAAAAVVGVVRRRAAAAVACAGVRSPAVGVPVGDRVVGGVRAGARVGRAGPAVIAVGLVVVVVFPRRVRRIGRRSRERAVECQRLVKARPTRRRCRARRGCSRPCRRIGRWSPSRCRNRSRNSCS